MKKLVFLLFTVLITGFSSVSVFAQCDRAQLSQIQCGYYNEGYEDGMKDAQENQRNDYRRYRNKLDSRLYENYYVQGYDEGYKNTRPSQQPFPPLSRPGRGTSTGVVDWTGRVDNRVNIVIRGNEISNQQVAGSFNSIYQNMSGVLPRRGATVSVNKLEGRGTAFVIQQPDRNNNFTAIVQVSDPQRSDDQYRLQINWQSQSFNTEERYSRGSVMWRGRVDQRVSIIVAGADVESFDDSKSGLSNVNFNINGYLAARPGTVSVKKRRGRGTVSVVQQPNRNNDYEAIIQIFDPDRSEDDYEIEINW